MDEVDTRRRIPGAAETLLAAHRFEATAMRQIAGADALHIAAGDALDDGDTGALYARLMSFMLGGRCVPLPAIPAKLTKRPRMRKAA